MATISPPRDLAPDERVANKIDEAQGASDLVAEWAAFFSTDGGRRAPRRVLKIEALPLARTYPDYDISNMIKDLRSRYPHVCNSIFAPWDIRWYFDEYDFYVQGGEFLWAVLNTMTEENQRKVEHLARTWSFTNRGSYKEFPIVCSETFPVEKAFHAHDIELHGLPLLQEVLRLVTVAYKRSEEACRPEAPIAQAVARE